MDNNPNPFLNPEWINIQKQYIDALTSLKPDQTAPDYHGGNQQAWQEALDHWWHSIGQQLPEGYKPLLDSIIRQTSAFYSIADQFAALLNDIAATGKEEDDWQAVMSRHFGKMKAGLDSYHSGNMSPGAGAAFAWRGPLEGWKQAAGSASMFPDEILDYFNKASENELFSRLTASPGIGPGREFQEKVGKAVRLWETYQRHYRDYCAAFTELSKLALDRLEEKILALAESGGKIRSVRELYNLWVDASEEVFAEFAFNADYSDLYGKLVNSLMAFKHHNDDMIDDILPLLNLPTRRSMNTVYQRQQQMRHQLRDSREAQKQIEKSLEQLTTELANLKTQHKAADHPPVRQRKTTAKAGTRKKPRPEHKSQKGSKA